MSMGRVVARVDFKGRADTEMHVLAANVNELLDAARSHGWGSLGSIWTEAGLQLQNHGPNAKLDASQLYTFSPCYVRVTTQGIEGETAVTAKTARALVLEVISLGWQYGCAHGTSALGTISNESGVHLCPDVLLEPGHLYTYHRPAGPPTKKPGTLKVEEKEEEKVEAKEEAQPPMKAAAMQIQGARLQASKIQSPGPPCFQTQKFKHRGCIRKDIDNSRRNLGTLQQNTHSMSVEEISRPGTLLVTPLRVSGGQCTNLTMTQC